MSGIRVPTTKKHKEPPLPKRPEITNLTPPQELPTRNVLEVHVSVKGIKPLARVKKKFQIAGTPVLALEVSTYIDELEDLYRVGMAHTQENMQVLQTYLHELMHVALWDDVSITHSEDPESLLHYYVEGDTTMPNAWDIDVMSKASKRIGQIHIKDPLNYTALADAVSCWNKWLGREFFKIL
jgi:hypothetical protein